MKFERFPFPVQDNFLIPEFIISSGYTASPALKDTCSDVPGIGVSSFCWPLFAFHMAMWKVQHCDSIFSTVDCKAVAALPIL